MALQAIAFYLMALTTIASGIAVVSARNPVHSVLFLIASFFSAAGLFVLLGAEFLAMLLVVVYVGAVAVLFLFVVMMLDVNFVELKQGFLRYLPVGATVAVLLFTELMIAIVASIEYPGAHAAPKPFAADLPNTQALGNVLYTDFIYPFQVSGVILLVSMIGAIVLTHRTRPGVRRQQIAAQVARKRSDAVELVKVQPGQGA